jgi:hypothetical protein
VFSEDRDTCDVCQGLAYEQIGFGELAGEAAEQAEDAQTNARGAHRDGVHRGEADLDRGGIGRTPRSGRSPPVAAWGAAKPIRERRVRYVEEVDKFERQVVGSRAPADVRMHSILS